MRTEDTDRACNTCWDKAAEGYGTGQIFQRRAAKYQKRLNLITYLGIALPALVGTLAMTFGVQGPVFAVAVVLAGLVALLQLALSIGAVVFGWQAKLEYARESAFANQQLSEEFKRLGDTGPNPPSDLSARFEALIARDLARTQQDAKHDVTDMEKRFGHRHGLRQFQRRCAGCQKVPTDLISTTCHVCGNFE